MKITKEKKEDNKEMERERTRSVKRTTGKTSTTAKIRKVDARRPTQELGWTYHKQSKYASQRRRSSAEATRQPTRNADDGE